MPDEADVIEVLAPRGLVPVDGAVVGGDEASDEFPIACRDFDPLGEFLVRFVAVARLTVFTKPGFGGMQRFDDRAGRIEATVQRVGERREGAWRCIGVSFGVIGDRVSSGAIAGQEHHQLAIEFGDRIAIDPDEEEDDPEQDEVDEGLDQRRDRWELGERRWW